MSQDRIALCENLAVEFDDGDLGGRVHSCDFGFLVFRVFVEAVADVGVGDPCIFPKEADGSVLGKGGLVGLKGGEGGD